MRGPLYFSWLVSALFLSLPLWGCSGDSPPQPPAGQQTAPPERGASRQPARSQHEPTGHEKVDAPSQLHASETPAPATEDGALAAPSDGTSGPLPAPAAQPAEKADPRSPAKEEKLIPRKVLFGNPEKAMARVSSDGQWLSFLAPVDGVLNVWVAPLEDIDAARPITKDTNRGIRSYSWSYSSRHLLYTQDTDGDENWRVYSVNVETAETLDLTPLEDVQAQIDTVSERFPKEVLIGLNDRDAQLHDLYRVNIETGERVLVQENPGFAGFLADDDYNVRFAVTFGPDGSQIMLEPDQEQGWKEYLRIGPLDAMTTHALAFDKTGNRLYFVDSRERNTSALTVLNLQSDEQELIADNPRADVGGVLIHPTEKHVQAVSFTYARKEWQILDPAVEADLEYLASVEDGEVEVTSRTLDDRHWTVAYIVDDGPVKFYRYDREAQQAHYLFSSRSDLDQYRLAKMHPVIIKARDGLQLVSYLTLPGESDPKATGRPREPLPMVLDVHGGPWARDTWGYNPVHQWLADRGYAVLSVNFRGSTGFGKEFINAANREWAGKMHEDLLDAVDWAVEQNIARKDKVAIMGGSYGGYATLVALTFTPEVFAAGVNIVGPSSLVTLLENAPPYWGPFMPVMKDRVGDHTTDEGRQELLARSPLPLVDRIQRPLLIGHGANDPRVKQHEADQIVAAMRERMIPVTYVLYPDEGHGFARPENRLSFNAVVEAFLAEHLGGRFEPVGDDFAGSSIEVPAGADGVPGLAPALGK